MISLIAIVVIVGVVGLVMMIVGNTNVDSSAQPSIIYTTDVADGNVGGMAVKFDSHKESNIQNSQLDKYGVDESGIKCLKSYELL